MPIIRVINSIQGGSGLAEDQYVNTFYFQTGSPSVSVDFDNILALMQDFYNTDPGGAVQAVGHYYTDILTGGAIAKMYDMADAIPRVPKAEEGYSFAATGKTPNTNLPQEVAGCLSFAADPVAGIPAASLRGRVYLGPLQTSAMSEPVLTGPCLSAGFIDSCTQAAIRLQFQAGVFGLTWGVWSQKLSSFHKVTHAWMDNAFDTQRRRGVDATVRTTVNTPSGP